VGSKATLTYACRPGGVNRQAGKRSDPVYRPRRSWAIQNLAYFWPGGLRPYLDSPTMPNGRTFGILAPTGRWSPASRCFGFELPLRLVQCDSVLLRNFWILEVQLPQASRN